MRIARRSLIGVGVVLSLVLGAQVALVVPAGAVTTLTVTTTVDNDPSLSGPCHDGSTTVAPPVSLRDATCLANNIGGEVTINVPAGTFDLAFGELQIGTGSGQDVTIAGAGASTSGTVIDAQGASRVLDLDPNTVGGVTVAITGVRVTGGADSGFGGAGIIGGSAGSVPADVLIIGNSSITGNNANTAAPASTNIPGGGIQFVGGQLEITGSTISNNTSGSSPGAGVAYQAQGAGTESFAMTDDVVTGNSGGNTFGVGVVNGGAIDLASASGTTSMTVTHVQFGSNTMTGTAGPVAGAALRLENGTLSVSDSTFTGNAVTGSGSTGGAISVAAGTATITKNRIVGNSAPASSGGGIARSGGTVDATDNWWGCNGGPGVSGCDTVAGTLSTSPRLVLGGPASTPTVPSTGSTSVSADIRHDSTGAPIASLLPVFDALPLTFSDPTPSGATCTPPTATLTSTATGACTFAPNGATGSGHVVVTLDNQSITIPITITTAPVISTQPTDQTVAPNTSVSFSAAATGDPAPTVQWQKSTGGAFTDIPSATSATLTFTAVAGDDGSQYQAVFTNTAGHATTDAATLHVQEAPAFTSSDSMPAAAGVQSSMLITTSGTPNATITLTGTVPSWVSITASTNGTATLTVLPPVGSGGVHVVNLHAANGVAPAADQPFTITVDEAPHINSTNQATFTVGTAGDSFTITTDRGYPTPLTMSESGALPTGMSFTPLSNGTATLSGTPAAGTGGSYPLTFTATNTFSHDDQSFTLIVNQRPAFTSADQATFTVGTDGTFDVTTTGFPAAGLTIDPAVPNGLTFHDNGDGTATLHGTPAAGTGGSYPLTITAANAAGQPEQAFTLTIDEAPAITSADHSTFASGVAGSFTVTTSGFPDSSITETGALPSGVTFQSNGDGTATIGGTPAGGTAGDHSITVTASNGSGGPAIQTFTLTVTTAPQTVTFTSTAPSPAVVGQHYRVSATGGASGQPVTFAIDSSSASVCAISGSTVRFTHPGSCAINAHQDGNAQYAPGNASQRVPVTKAATTTRLAVRAHSIKATVSTVAPGAGTPTGSVDFSVGGKSVGTATLTGGVATLSYTVPAGKTRHVSAAYSGDGDFTGSSASTARHDPSITATVSSTVKKSPHGWYRTPVTVRFQCTTNGAPLTTGCPKAVTLRRNGAGQSVSRTITSTDGGADSITVRGINIDRTAPRVRIAGVRSGGQYYAAPPAARCVGADALSGVASCRLASTQRGTRVRLTATATDRAGNTSAVQVSYQRVRFFVLSAPYRNGAFALREGQSYTVVALTSGNHAPRFYDAAPDGQTPHPAGPVFHAAGRQFGQHRWTLHVYIDRGLGRYPFWNLGVKTGATMHLIRFRPIG